MKAISGRSSAVNGAPTLVLEPAMEELSTFSSGFKFTSAMLTYFRSLISENDGRSDKTEARLASGLEAARRAARTISTIALRRKTRSAPACAADCDHFQKPL